MPSGAIRNCASASNRRPAEGGTFRKNLGRQVMVFPPPPVRGVGRAGGFTMMVEDRGDVGPAELQTRPKTWWQLATRRGQLMATCSRRFAPTCRN